MKIRIKTEIWNYPQRFVKLVYVWQFFVILFVIINMRSLAAWTLGAICTIFTLVIQRSYTQWEKKNMPNSR